MCIVRARLPLVRFPCMGLRRVCLKLHLARRSSPARIGSREAMTRRGAMKSPHPHPSAADWTLEGGYLRQAHHDTMFGA